MSTHIEDQPRQTTGQFDRKAQSAPETETVEAITPLTKYMVNFRITGSHSVVVEAHSAEDALQIAADEASENADDVYYEFEHTSTTVEP